MEACGAAEGIVGCDDAGLEACGAAEGVVGVVAALDCFGVAGVVAEPLPLPPMVKSMHDSYDWLMDAASHHHWITQSPAVAHSLLTSGMVMEKDVQSGCWDMGDDVRAY